MGRMEMVKTDQTCIRIGIVDPISLDRDALSISLRQQAEIYLQFTIAHADNIPSKVNDIDVLVFCSRHVDDVLTMTGEYWSLRCPNTRLIVLLEPNEQILAQRYTQMGGGCFAVRSDLDIPALVSLIRNVHSGEVVDAFAQLGNWVDKGTGNSQVLSARELQVIALLRELGPRQRKAGAQRMGISYKTYGTHILNICAKLGVNGVDEILEKMSGADRVIEHLHPMET